MPSLHISSVLSIAVAATVGFSGGYLFHAGSKPDEAAARKAVFEAQRLQRVVQAYEPVSSNLRIYRELASIQSIEDVRRLQAKYRETAIIGIVSFERSSKALELPLDRWLAEPFLQEATKVRVELNATP